MEVENTVELTLYIEYPKHREMTSKRKTERFEKEEEEMREKDREKNGGGR